MATDEFGYPAWLDGHAAWPPALLENWTLRWGRGVAACAMPGCTEPTTVTVCPGGFNRPDEQDKARPTCSLAHTLMIVSGEAGPWQS